MANILEGLGLKPMNAEKEVRIDRLVTINGYEAGKNGNLLVACDDNLIIAHLKKSGWSFTKSQKYAVVKPLITTAYIFDWDDQVTLSKYCDAKTASDKVIVVNNKFLSVFFLNPYRRVLLEAQSAKSNHLEFVTCLEQTTVAEYCAALENHNRFTVRHAFKKRDKILNSQSEKLGLAQKRETRRDSGNMWEMNEIGSASSASK